MAERLLSQDVTSVLSSLWPLDHTGGEKLKLQMITLSRPDVLPLRWSEDEGHAPR